MANYAKLFFGIISAMNCGGSDVIINYDGYYSYFNVVVIKVEVTRSLHCNKAKKRSLVD